VSNLDKDPSIDWNERLFEAMLEVAVEEAVIQEMAALPSRKELDILYPYSAEFDNKIRRIINQEKKSYKRRQVARVFMKVVTYISIVFIVGTVVLMSVEASRTIILNAVISMQQDHISFEFAEDNPIQNSTEQLLLDGYDYTGTQIIGDLTISIYVNTVGEQIMIHQHEGSSLHVAIDTDYREFLPITINEKAAFIFESTDDGERHVVMWEQGNIVFQTFSNVAVEELLKFVEFFIEG
jgi:hypothetical protein